MEKTVRVSSSQWFPCASGVLEARMPFVSSREYCLRLIATACVQADCLSIVVALESLRTTHSTGKDAACC